MNPVCPHCGHVHTEYSSTVVIGRFTDSPRYRAHYPNAPLRSTRAQAHADACAYFAAKETT